MAVVVPLAAAMSMGASHAAMAACSALAASPPATGQNEFVKCTGDGNTNNTVINFSGTVAATGIFLTTSDAVPDDDSTGSLTNNKNITVQAATLGTTSNTNIRGITTDDAGAYSITNNGEIKVLSSSGRGQVYGIAGNGDVGELVLLNTSLIEATRTFSAPAQITSAAINVTNLANVSAGNANTVGNLNVGNNATTTSMGIAAAVFTEEELDTLEIENAKGATIRGVGKQAFGIYNRAEEFTLTNKGLIENSLGKGGGVAIGTVSDSGKVSTFEFTNTETGVVKGDIVAAGVHAQRWWLLSRGEGTGNVSTGNVVGGTAIDNRLNINSQFGQLDTEIENEGKIDGHIYLGNGAHELVNEGEDAQITGNIDVDQRAMVFTSGPSQCWVSGANPSNRAACPSVITASNLNKAIPSVNVDEPGDAGPNQVVELVGFFQTNTLDGGTGTGYAYQVRHTIWGSKEFSFENSGTFIGNITVATAPATTINVTSSGSGVPSSYTVPDSQVTLAPHVFGGGGTSANAATGPGTIATFQGILKVADGMVNGAGGVSSLGRTTTIAPVIAGTVKDGEWYKVADKVFGGDSDADLPEVEGTALVQWEAAKNASDALVIGAEVADAGDLEGVSKPAAAAINALIDAGGSDPDLDALGGAVQSLESEEEVAKAGAQLAPESNFATQQAAITLNQATGQHIDTRLASAGVTGSSGGFGGPSGLGMKPSAQGRSNLGANAYSEDYVSPTSTALWGHAFGAGLNQDQRDLVDGYDARLYGLMAGYDNWIASNTRLGVAVGYANTKIDGKGFTAQNSTDIDSWLVEVYGAVKGAGWYVTGRTGFTWHTIDTSRVLTVPFRDSASGSHDGQQFNAAVELGTPMRMSGAVFTPIASLTYSNLEQDGCSETSGAGMALSIGSQSNDSLVSGLGVKAVVPIAADTAIEGRAVWLHEFFDTNQTVNAAFAAGGSGFTASGPDVGRDTAALGVGMIANVDANTSFQLNYDANIRQDFIGHVGSARVTVGF